MVFYRQNVTKLISEFNNYDLTPPSPNNMGNSDLINHS